MNFVAIKSIISNTSESDARELKWEARNSTFWKFTCVNSLIFLYLFYCETPMYVSFEESKIVRMKTA